MNKKEALKELEEIKKRMDVLEGIINKTEVEYYDVVTPVNVNGNILFNNNNQYLSIFHGMYVVTPFMSAREDRSKYFVWVPCKAEDIKMGDTFYCTNDDDRDFSGNDLVRKALEDGAGKYCYVADDEDIIVNSENWEYYYKLTKKPELGL